MKARRTRVMLVGILVTVFGLGYLCGSMSQQRAAAQGVGGILEQAGKMGGSAGAAGQLGNSILEMQQHVSGLQKNLDTLKGIQSALTGK
jgi:hypothetical protein